MTVRLTKELGLGVERYSAQTGHKPAKLGALAVDEFMRRRAFPLIDFRETAAGRGSVPASYFLKYSSSRFQVT